MIGVVILNYKNWEDTLRCIKSIYENPPIEEYRIILVDNASPCQPEYDLQEILGLYNVIYIENEKNLGYNAGNNVGIAKALEIGCEYILISNNDVRYFPGSIQAMKRELDSDRKIGIVGPKILDENGVIQKSNLCRKTGLKEKYMVRTRANAMFRKSHASYFGFDRDYDKRFEVYAVLGCCFMMSRICAMQVTPLDEYPFLYEEELILGIHMEEHGFRTVYNPEAVIEHLHGKSTSQVRAFSFAHNVRSEIYYCRKYLKAKKAAILPLYYYRVILYLIRCPQYKDFRQNLRWFLNMTKDELLFCNKNVIIK